VFSPVARGRGSGNGIDCMQSSTECTIVEIVGATPLHGAVTTPIDYGDLFKPGTFPWVGNQVNSTGLAARLLTRGSSCHMWRGNEDLVGHERHVHGVAEIAARNSRSSRQDHPGCIPNARN
jgi:hypothetical protein